jgi:hypothetical protein
MFDGILNSCIDALCQKTCVSDKVMVAVDEACSGLRKAQQEQLVLHGSPTGLLRPGWLVVVAGFCGG